jgi:hypothetical protein
MRELKEFRIVDDLQESDRIGIEVELILESGEKRWCYFMTPSALASCGDWIPGTRIRFHYGAPHMIVVSELNQDVIQQVLDDLDCARELRACTRAFE